MPLYEYSCRQCEHTFEALVFDGEKVECPACQSTRLERLLSVPARPRAEGVSLPTSCGDPGLPPCGAPWCQRTGPK
jgi:putative FmdB family regulatory protein